MSALDNMRKRLDYNGGVNQQSRMISDKLHSLKKASLYSYQGATIIIDNPDYDEKSNEGLGGLQSLKFRGLMNPDKLSYEADKKILSIPFRDICLNAPRVGKTSEGIVDIPISCGDTFEWEETKTRWLVTVRYVEELAYFRADVRKCYPFPLNIDGKDYWFSNVGQEQQTLEWYKKNRDVLNKLNYTRALYFKRNDSTLDYFKRFKIVKLPNIKGELKPWEVQAVEPNIIDDLIVVFVKEYFNNEFEEVSAEEQAKIQENHELLEDTVVYIYEKISFKTDYIEGAAWTIENITNQNLRFDIDAIKDGDFSIVYIQLYGQTGEFDICYNNKVMKHIVVKSF